MLGIWLAFSALTRQGDPGAVWVFDLSHLIVGVAAVLAGVCTAIASYFWIHSDTDFTRSQKWEHIWGLLTFFIMGVCVAGLIGALALRLIEST